MVDLERIITSSFDAWIKNIRLLAAAGIIALFLELLIFYIGLLLGWYLVPIFVVLAVIVHWAVLFSAAHIALSKKNKGLRDVFSILRVKFLDFGITFLLLFLSLLTPALLAFGAGYSSFLLKPLLVFSFLLVFAVLPTIFLLAPAYAMEYPWDEALRKSFEANKKHFLSILLLGGFFLFLFLFLVTLLSISELVYIIILVNAVFFYPLAALAIIKLARSIR